MTYQDVRRTIARLVVMIGGEAMQSAFHLGINLALLHQVSAHDYGIFALVMVIGGLGLTYVRSLTGLPASICISQSRSAAAANALEITFGSAATLLAAALCIAVTAVLNLWLDHGALAGGLVVGLWAARSHLRTVYFARGRQTLVSISDIVFTIGGASGAGVVLLGGGYVLQNMLVSLAVANALGILVLLTAHRHPIRISLGRHALRRYAKLWPDLKWSLLSVSITNLQGQSMALLVAAIAGPAAYAPIAAALVMFVPLRIVGTAFANMMHPELSAMLARGDDTSVGRLRTWTAPLALLGLAYCAAVLLAVPFIQPDSLENARFYTIAVIAWAICVIPLLYVMPRIWLEITLDYRGIAILSAIAAIVGLALVVVILLTTSSSWAVLGGAVSEAIVLAGTWGIVTYRKRARASG